MKEENAIPKSVPTKIPTDKIARNPENPRLIFVRAPLDELKDSISKVGILVPLIVYKSEKEAEYVLLDGERRLICAKELGLSEVPVNIINKPNPLENILRMFNIHRVRKQWSTIETALKIERIIEITGDDRESTLTDLTGLKRSQIRRYKQILKLPEKGKKLMLDFVKTGTNLEGKSSLMEEMLPVLRVIERDYPDLWLKFKNGDDLIDIFISKYKEGIITNVTDFRSLRKTFLSPIKGVSEKKVINNFREFIESDKITINELYEKTAKPAYDFEGVIKDCEKLAENLSEINLEFLDFDEKKILEEKLKSLEKNIASLKISLGGN